MFQHVAKISSLDLAKLNVVLEETGSINLKFSITEVALLKEFVMVLRPFQEVTMATQGEKVT